MTPKSGWQERFLAALEKSPNVSKACRAAGVSRGHAYREKEEDPEFGTAWDDRLEAALDALEEAAHRRARKDSDTLCIFLLKSHRPAVYQEKKTVDLTTGGKPFKVYAGFDPEDV